MQLSAIEFALLTQAVDAAQSQLELDPPPEPLEPEHAFVKSHVPEN